MNGTGELAVLRANGLYRRLRAQEDLGATVAIIDGRRLTLFATNDYLGLSRHPEIIRAAGLACEKYGNSAGASRLISGNNCLYRSLEKKLAALKGKEAALVFPTGYMANLGLITTLVGSNDLIIMDKYNHASLYDAARLSGATVLRYAHNNLDHLQRRLTASAPTGISPGRSGTAGGFRRRVILTDGVFSADGDLAPLPELANLAREHDCRLIVDDAHGTGVLGADGSGSSAHLETSAPIEIGTLSKALGALGGFVAADRDTVDLLINKARPFIFTTGLPPATLAAADTALDVMKKEPWRRRRVLDSARRVRKGLTAAGFQIAPGPTPIIPIIVGPERTTLALAEGCQKRGIFIPPVRHPTVPKNQARLRMTVSAAHSDKEIDLALDALTSAGRELGLV